MTDHQIRYAFSRMDGDTDQRLAYAKIVWDGLGSAQREVLTQLLFQGPVYDGNIPSKSARDDLISYGLAARVCFLGEQGYTAATYKALPVFERGGGIPIRKKAGKPS